jgi:pyruvate dehydrogenase E2 component (dihydrolipoamide acetyltransferase)
MATEVVMPRLSDSMEEGTIVKWLVDQGGTVKRGEPLVEIETDKANMTYDADTDGTLIEVLAKEGATLPVGKPIARVGDASEAESSSGNGGGRIVEAAAEGGGERAAERREAGAKGEVEIHEQTRQQQTVSRRMAESKATAPDYVLTVDVDMTLAVDLRKRLEDDAERPPSYNDMVVKAAANALREHPRVNGAYRDGKFELYSRVNVGIAVAAQDALVVPTIFDADRKSLGQIARDTHAAAEKVRAGEITPPEVAGGTFTVSNLGMYGIDEFTAIINPPQAAILTVGALKKQPAVDESGRVVGRDQLRLSLIADHRILYGAEAAAFLARVRELLEQPLALAL